MQTLDEKKGTKLVKKALIVLGVIYLVIVFVFLIRIANGETCGRIDYSNYGGGAISAGVTIDSPEEFLSQQIGFIEKNRFKHYGICFSANATTDLRVEILDQERHVLTKGYVAEGFDRYCLYLKNGYNHTYNFIGVNCPDCAPGSEITFYQETLGHNNFLTIQDVKGAGLNVSNSKSYDWVFTVYPTCWNSIKYFTIWYLTASIFFMVILGLIVGLRKTEEVINKE